MTFRTVDAHIEKLAAHWERGLGGWNALFDALAPDCDSSWDGINAWYCLWCMTPRPVAYNMQPTALRVCRDCGRLAAINLRRFFDLGTRQILPGIMPISAFAGMYDETETVDEILRRQNVVLDLALVLAHSDTLVRWVPDGPMRQMITLPPKLFQCPDRHYIRGRANRAWWEEHFGAIGEGGTPSQNWIQVSYLPDLPAEEMALFLRTIAGITSGNICFDEERAQRFRDELRESEWFDKGRNRWISYFGGHRNTEDVEIWDALWSLATKRIGHRGSITSNGSVSFPFEEAMKAVTMKDLAVLCQEFGVDPESLTCSLE
jgi:hypothetical protein